jgi:acetate kinase
MLASNRPQARQAIDIFTFGISGEITWRRHSAALMQSYSPQVSVKTSRKSAPWCANGWPGSAWRSMPARARGMPKGPSNGSSRIAVFVIATDEEQVIADEVLSVLKQKGVSRGVHR